MTLALDTTALLARFLSGPTRATVVDAMADDGDWCASALALTEALMLVDRLTDPGQAVVLRRALRDDWDCFAVVPVDQVCLDRAADLGRQHPLRTTDAIHLAAADRLPRPTTYLTFDAHQIPVALALGLDVVSTATPGRSGRSAGTGRHPGGMLSS